MIHQMRSVPLVLTALARVALGGSPDACASLATWPALAAASVRINIAELVTNGSFQGDTENSDYNIQLSGLPEHCRVAAQFNTSTQSTVHFEVWMPIASNWNGRFLAVGNGGWAGAINYPDISMGLKQNFPTMSSNNGHNGSSTGVPYFLQNEDESIDLHNPALTAVDQSGHRGMHLSVQYAKDIVAAYYAANSSYSYYMGCSTGGRQGMAEAQLYPDDFDGILVGAPVIWQTHLEAWENYVGKDQYPSTLPTSISTDQWTAIHDEAVRQCDGLDGVVDGLISDPTRCNFVPETLLCTGAATDPDTCLTGPQMENLHMVYGGWIDENNTLVFPGAPVGSELNGVTYYTNEVQGGFGLGFYQYGIVNDTNWTSADISYADVALADTINSYGALTDAFSPNLTAFAAHGGKLLHYHGLQDSINNAPISALYYKSVLSFFAAAAGAAADGTVEASPLPPPLARVSDFYRLLSIPGMGHCSGGDGAWAVGTPNQILPPLVNDTAHSALQALVAWREGGDAPTQLIGTKYVNQTTIGDQAANLSVAATRPSCLWPAIPVYLGTGDVNDATSWRCPDSGLF